MTAPRRRTVAVLTLGGLFALVGAAMTLSRHEERVSFDAVFEIFASLFRDVDRFGLQITQISQAREVEIGRETARVVEAQHRLLDDPVRGRYVSHVGDALVPFVQRKQIPYTFKIVASRQVNAFALPGGFIFVTAGMLGFLRSEAELAALLGHEISHVDMKHCVERLQYELIARRVVGRDIATIVRIAYGLGAVGFSKQQELEADVGGLILGAKAGYDPNAALAFEERLHAIAAEREKPKGRPGTMVGEAGGALVESLQTYFRTHPPPAQRVQAMRDAIASNAAAWRGEKFYVGAENYKKWLTREQVDLPSEWTTFK